MNERDLERIRVVEKFINNELDPEEGKFLALEMIRLLKGGKPGLIDVALPDEINLASSPDRPR